MVEFSSRGRPLTPFERDLFERTASTHPQSFDGLGVWLSIAQRIGLDNLIAVLDELGGERFHVPQRDAFFEALWRPARDDEVLRRLANGEGAIAIAQRLGITALMVRQIRFRAGRLSRGSVIRGEHGNH